MTWMAHTGPFDNEEIRQLWETVIPLHPFSHHSNPNPSQLLPRLLQEPPNGSSPNHLSPHTVTSLTVTDR